MSQHNTLVKNLKSYVSTEWKGDILLIMTDHQSNKEKPVKVGDHIPDLYARTKRKQIIIGEAKTAEDFRTNRSQRQIIDFMQFTHDNSGVFIFSTTWNAHIEVMNQLKLLCRINNFSIPIHIVHCIGAKHIHATH